MNLKIGKKYRIFIPADHKKRSNKLFVGTVIYKTDKRDKYGCWVRVCPTEDGEYVELGRG